MRRRTPEQLAKFGFRAMKKIAYCPRCDSPKSVGILMDRPCMEYHDLICHCIECGTEWSEWSRKRKEQ